VKGGENSTDYKINAFNDRSSGQIDNFNPDFLQLNTNVQQMKGARYEI